MNRTLTIGCLVAPLAAGLMLSQAITARRAADATLATERRQREAAQGALSAAEQRAAQARAKFEAAQASLAQLDQNPPATMGANAAARTQRAPGGTEMSIADAARKWAAERDRPENQVKWFTQLRRSNQKRYDPLFRELQLNEAQRAEFIEILGRRDERHSDLNAAAQALGVSPDDREIVKLRGELYAEADRAQKALLGESGYSRAQEFDRTASLRESVANMAGLAAVSGLALTPTQMDQLVRRLADHSPGYRKGGRASLVDVNPTELPAVLAGVLTAEQQHLFSTQEIPGGSGAIFHSQWNAALVKATKAERQKAAAKSGPP